MENLDTSVGSATVKLQLYLAAEYLFERGLSHPQVVAALVEMVPDEKLVTAMTDKAMTEEWSKLAVEAKDLLGEGVAYDAVIQQVQAKEPDEEIARRIVSDLYSLKTEYAENLTEGSSNVSEAGLIAPLSAVGLFLVFWFNGPLGLKIALSILFPISVALWFVGRWQKRRAVHIERFFQRENP